MPRMTKEAAQNIAARKAGYGSPKAAEAAAKLRAKVEQHIRDRVDNGVPLTLDEARELVRRYPRYRKRIPERFSQRKPPLSPREQLGKLITQIAKLAAKHKCVNAPDGSIDRQRVRDVFYTEYPKERVKACRGVLEAVRDWKPDALGVVLGDNLRTSR